MKKVKNCNSSVINWIIANCFKSENYFYTIRQQITLLYCKSLVIVTPKVLIDYPDAKSNIDQITENTEF